MPRNRPAAQPTAERLGYLLKVAQLRFTDQVRDALIPLEIDNREWAALVTLDEWGPASQADIAKGAGIDRTTMVALIDQLQARGLARRRPDREDRRKNVVELTPAGRRLTRRAARLVDDCERRFLASLGDADAQRLKALLQTLTAAPTERPRVNARAD